jgi:Tfp pilus assembly protein PilW
MNIKNIQKLIVPLFFIVNSWHGTIISSPSPLSATFKIIDHTEWKLSNEDWRASYLATITVTNNGSSKVSGWQLDFSLNTNDQIIKRIWNGRTQTYTNPITIINNPQHINIMPGTSRTVYLVVNNPTNTNPKPPKVIATALKIVT